MGGGFWWSSWIRDLGCFWCAAWVSANDNRRYPTQTLPLPPPLCHSVTWSEQGWSFRSACTGAPSEVVVRNPAAARADLSLSTLGASLQMHSSWVESRLPSALLLVPVALQPAKRALSSLHRTPGLGHPVCDSNHPLRRAVSTRVTSPFLWVPSQEHRSQPDHYSLVVQESFCQFPVSLQWELFNMLMYFWCVHWGRWAPHLTLPSWSEPLKLFLIIEKTNKRAYEVCWFSFAAVFLQSCFYFSEFLTVDRIRYVSSAQISVKMKKSEEGKECKKCVDCELCVCLVWCTLPMTPPSYQKV